MMQKAIVFDLDGTLLDTLEDIAISANYALEQLGFEPHPLKAYRYFVGEGVFKLFENIFSSAPQPTSVVHKAVELFELHYATQYNQTTKPYEGVNKMLTFLQTRGLKMAVLSNKPNAFTKKCVLKYFRQWDFEVVYGAREGIARKPDPTAALEIAEILGVEPSECYYLGDTMIDMQTANRSGMVPLGALWGFRDADELQEHGAKYLLKSPSDVIKLLAEAHSL